MTDDTIRDYDRVVQSPVWERTRRLTVDGDLFRHEKHPADVHEGLQHKIFVWICEAKRPRDYCGCGLYRLQWVAPEHPDGAVTSQ